MQDQQWKNENYITSKKRYFNSISRQQNTLNHSVNAIDENPYYPNDSFDNRSKM